MSHDAINWITKHSKSSLPYNAMGVKWGPKIKNGKETGEYAVIFDVQRKMSSYKLAANNVVPSAIEINGVSYPTDIQVHTVHKKLADCYFTDYDTDPQVQPIESNCVRSRPLSGGCEVDNFWGTFAGTLGLIVRDVSDGQLVTLSNNHVLAGSTINAFYYAVVPEVVNSAGIKTMDTLSCFQPTWPTANGGWVTTSGNDFYGDAKRCVIIGDVDYTLNYHGYITSTSCDAGIGKISNIADIDSTSNSVINFKQVGPYAFATQSEINSLVVPESVNYGSPLFRSGRTCGPMGIPGSSYESGCGNLSAYQIGIAAVGDYSTFISNFEGCIYMRGDVASLRGGDSGTAVFALLSSAMPTASAWKCIGLGFAGSGDLSYGIVTPITNIAENLKIASWDGTMPTLSSKSTFIEAYDYATTITLSGRTFYQTGLV